MKKLVLFTLTLAALLLVGCKANYPVAKRGKDCRENLLHLPSS